MSAAAEIANRRGLVTVKVDASAARLLKAAAFVRGRSQVDVLSDLVRADAGNDDDVRDALRLADKRPTRPS